MRILILSFKFLFFMGESDTSREGRKLLRCLLGLATVTTTALSFMPPSSTLAAEAHQSGESAQEEALQGQPDQAKQQQSANYVFDGNGVKIRVQVHREPSSRTAFDGCNAVTQRGELVTTYYYLPNGQLTSLIDEFGNVRESGVTIFVPDIGSREIINICQPQQPIAH